MRREDPKRVLKNVGRRIAEIRVARELTQERFAETVLGVSLKYAQAIEAGRENLTVESLVKIAVKLRVPVASLFERPASTRVRRGRPKKAKP